MRSDSHILHPTSCTPKIDLYLYPARTGFRLHLGGFARRTIRWKDGGGLAKGSLRSYLLALAVPGRWRPVYSTSSLYGWATFLHDHFAIVSPLRFRYETANLQYSCA